MFNIGLAHKYKKDGDKDRSRSRKSKDFHMSVSPAMNRQEKSSPQFDFSHKSNRLSSPVHLNLDKKLADESKSLSKKTATKADLMLKREREAIIDTAEIPEEFKMGEVKKDGNSKHCNLCLETFVILKRPRKNCKRCGIAICKLCRANKMPLSKKDPKFYSVCNECYAKR